jgi:hypothetical protein
MFAGTGASETFDKEVFVMIRPQLRRWIKEWECMVAATGPTRINVYYYYEGRGIRLSWTEDCSSLTLAMLSNRQLR